MLARTRLHSILGTMYVRTLSVTYIPTLLPTQYRLKNDMIYLWTLYFCELSTFPWACRDFRAWKFGWQKYFAVFFRSCSIWTFRLDWKRICGELGETVHRYWTKVKLTYYIRQNRLEIFLVTTLILQLRAGLFERTLSSLVIGLYHNR